ncbi:MAG: type II secretion system F family protein [Planctomycetota bacterium]
MPTYVTKVRYQDGTTGEQLLTVPSEAQLNDYLAKVDGFVVDYERYVEDDPAPKTVSVEDRRAPSKARVPYKELVSFSWYLYTLVEAGVPLLKALQVVAGQMESETWKSVLDQVTDDLQRGESLGESLRRFPRCFPKHYVHLVEVGEISGQLDRVLEQLALHGEKQIDTRGRIRSALAYPAFLLFSCVGVIGFLMVFVLPKVSKMFTRASLELPTVTRIAMGASTFMKENIILLMLGAVAGVTAIVVTRTRPAMQNFWSRVALNMPCLGMLYQKYIMANYCRTLALLNQAGVSILVSLEVARNGLNNTVLRDFFVTVEANLQEGESLGAELSKSAYVPEMVSSMIGVGEETGRLSDMLQNVTRFYERDIDQTIQILPKIVEPLVIVMMTGVVALIATSVFLPLSKLTAGIG